MNLPTLSASIQPYIDRHELAGAVLFVADKQGTLAVEALGWADVDARQPMMPGTLFWIASQTKPMTAVGVMMLGEEGKLSIEDPVAKYLPDFAGQMVIARKDEAEILLRKPARPITIKDLLTHTSGLPFSSLIEQPTLDMLPLSTCVRSYAMCPLEFEPGTTTLYSNAGFNTAARIIEVVTGQAYERFLEARLFHPLGMHDTTFWPDAEQASHLAASYQSDPGDGHLVRIPISQLHYPLTDGSKRYAVPAGGLFSTARDLTLFYRMVLNDGSLDGRTYLSPSTVREMTRRHTPETWERPQGLAFGSDGKTFGHGGAYGTDTQVDVATGLILGWLIQQEGPFYGDAASAKDTFQKAAIEKFGTR